jgi:SAM-dependent methyltransferase
MSQSITSLLGYLLYLIRRNDKSWKSLSSNDQALVFKANMLHNTMRPDYADPKQYQGGESFDSKQSRLARLEGRRLQAFLDEVKPKSVLEVGPGSGFYTQIIVTHPAVVSFTGIDIAQSFLDFIEPHLKSLKSRKPDFRYSLQPGNFMEMNFDLNDAIILTSTAHHIPNRLDLVRWIHKNLLIGGRCFMFEPTHYLPRINDLLGKFMHTYYKADHRTKIENLSTHHFCTLEEFESLCNQVPGLEIKTYSFHRMQFPKIARKALDRLFRLLKVPREDQWGVYVSDRRSILRFFSQRMFIEFVKTA